ncbi:MAG TPA: hypothetical protein VKY29_00740 [Cryomorphaceae bacterium]|nr:hypothetical protein [Cryomorphaceae bacterium]
MKRLKKPPVFHSLSAISACFLSLFLISASSAVAQDSGAEKTYHRVFEIRVDHWSADELQSVERTLTEGVMELRERCAEKQTFLIAVDASYPKRVGDIREEIRTRLEETFSPDRVHKIESIPHQKSVNYCK